MNKIRKISCDPQNMTIRDIVADYNEKRMAVVKDFQRREVWKKKTVNEYIESVSEGTAVSGIIVADIDSGLEASEAAGDILGIERYKKLQNEGKKTVNEDGQNRLRKGLMAFVNNDTTFTGTLYDLDYNPRQFTNTKFEKLPESFQHAFLNSTALIVTIKNAPFNKLPSIFRKLNSGDALNRTEMRQSFQSEISDWIRSYSEGTFADMWPRFTGCRAQAISRMRDIEWMTQAFMTCNVHTKNRYLLDDDMDWFFKIGENRPISKVKEYDADERKRFISILEMVYQTVMQQQSVPASKSIPQRTFWALIMVAECFYDSSGRHVVHSFDQFYKDVYSIDSELVTESKIQQSIDIKNARKSNPHLEDDEINSLVPDNNYYWRWCHRMQTPIARTKRKELLINEIKKRIDAGRFPSILPQEAVA